MMDAYEPEFTHVNGVWWYDAPLPRRWHRCTVWSSGAIDGFGINMVERCACGAICHRGDRIWIERNSRRAEVAS